MSGKSLKLKDGYYVSQSKEKNVLRAAINGHLSVYPSALVTIAGKKAIFFKDGKKIWEANAEYAGLHFDLTPLQTGWFTDLFNRAGTGHFMIVEEDKATSLCGRHIAVENLQSESECLKKCVKCTKAHARNSPASA